MFANVAMGTSAGRFLVGPAVGRCRRNVCGRCCMLLMNLINMDFEGEIYLLVGSVAYLSVALAGTAPPLGCRPYSGCSIQCLQWPIASMVVWLLPSFGARFSPCRRWMQALPASPSNPFTHPKPSTSNIPTAIPSFGPGMQICCNVYTGRRMQGLETAQAR